MKQTDFVQLARKYSVLFYIAAGIMLVADFVVMYRNYTAYQELRFNWVVFNVYVLSIMGATLALAGKLSSRSRTGLSGSRRPVSSYTPLIFYGYTR